MLRIFEFNVKNQRDNADDEASNTPPAVYFLFLKIASAVFILVKWLDYIDIRVGYIDIGLRFMAIMLCPIS